MANFHIDCTKAEHAVAQLRVSAKDLSAVGNDAAGIHQALENTFHASSMTLAAQRVKQLESRLLDEAVQMDTLAAALEKVIAQYRAAEAGILAQGFGDGMPDAVQSDSETSDSGFWTWFRSVLVSIGIVKAEKQTRVEGEAVTKYQEKEMDRYMQNEIGKVLKEERFQEKTWKKADVDERKQILNEYLQKVAAVMGISIGGISYIYRESQNGYVTLGQYSSSTHTISINEWILENWSAKDSYTLTKTIVHEMRHAYQHAVCENPEQFVVTEETIQAWQDSFDNYKSQSGFMAEGMSESKAYQAYRAQAVEADARAFAKQ